MGKDVFEYIIIKKITMSKYLSIGNACNLKCKFCYNDLNRETNNFLYDLKDIYKNINDIKKINNNINIVGGEPFIHPDILKILAYIFTLKFNHVWIVTNGIKLANLKFAINLYKYKVNSIEFSIHANNSELEKKITQRNGNNLFKREQGIKNILFLNRKFKNKISLNSNTVINKLNYKEIINIIKYIRNLGIKKLAISFMYNLKGLSNINKDLFVKYSDVIKILNKSDENFSELNIDIDWLPYCMHKKIKKIKYKIREEEDCKKYNKNYKYIDSKIKYKIKLKECDKCSVYGKLCNGVFKEYIDIFGINEFKSIK